MDTRLGNDAAKTNRMARSVMGRISDEQRRRDSAGLSGEQRAAAMTQRRKVDKAQWDSADSHKDESKIWRGGVAMGSYGEVEARMAGLISDCRGWSQAGECTREAYIRAGVRNGWWWWWLTHRTKCTVLGTISGATTHSGLGNVRRRRQTARR